MTQETFSPEQFRATLNEMGEATVRDYLATNRWARTGHKYALATGCLEDQDRARRAASEAENVALAKADAEAASRAALAAERAASAAERSADTAERALATAQAANTRATIALVIAAISIIAIVVISYLRPS